MPKEDKAGTQKHIRFGRISPEIYDALVGIPGVKAVVLHTKGKKSENPHWHIWWESETPITDQTFRNWAHKLPPLKDFSGNKDWSFRNHNSWEAWATYVCGNLSHQVILSYKDLDEYSSKARIQVPTPPPEDIIEHDFGSAVKSSSRMRWDERICHDAETRLLWKRGEQFDITSVEYGTAQKAVQKQIVSFMRGRFNNNEAVKYARNLLYEFGDEDVKEFMEERLFDNFRWL